MVQVEMFPANEGDCFLVTLIKQDYRILIDGGTSQTYKIFLRSRLLELSRQEKKIDLLIVTHIDNDHIGGIISLFKENGSFEEAKIIRVEEVWHNSYRHLQIPKDNIVGFREKEILGSILSNMSSLDNVHMQGNKQEISALQGTTLAGLLYKGGYKWNCLYNEKAINCEFKSDIYIGDNCYIKVLSPNIESLNKLMVDWKVELMKSKIDFQFSDDAIFDDAYEYYLRYLNEINCIEEEVSNSIEEVVSIDNLIKVNNRSDKKPTNNSSITFQLNCDDKRLLFLGDINIEKINYDQLVEKFDLIKMPHHASTNNIDYYFLRNFKSRHYLISTDGRKHNHPDIDVIAKIMASGTEEKNLFFNYFHEKLEIFNNREMKEKYHCKFHYPQEAKTIIVNI